MAITCGGFEANVPGTTRNNFLSRWSAPQGSEKNQTSADPNVTERKKLRKLN